MHRTFQGDAYESFSLACQSLLPASAHSCEIWLTQGLGKPFRPSGQDRAPSQSQATRHTKQSSGDDSEAAAGARLARGKKLVLRDGNFQLVREYERKGDRVRYYSLERGSWEEIPAAMVDWDATAKAQTESDKASEALLGKIHAQEEATKTETVLDVDASLQVACPVYFCRLGKECLPLRVKSVTPASAGGFASQNGQEDLLEASAFAGFRLCQESATWKFLVLRRKLRIRFPSGA